MHHRTSLEIGQSIKKARKMLKLRQCDVAFASGTGTRFIVDLEKGKETCQLGKVLHICHMLGISINLQLPNFKNMEKIHGK